MESVNVSEDFRRHIRLNNKVEMPYKAFLAILNTDEPTPNFDIALDGTYSHTKEHVDSKICFVFNQNECMCFLENRILETIKISKPSDKEHDSNWNEKVCTKEFFNYTNFDFGCNPFLTIGTRELKKQDCEIFINVKEEIVHIDFQSKIDGVYSNHLQCVIKKTNGLF